MEIELRQFACFRTPLSKAGVTIVLLTGFCANANALSQKYITDIFEVTMRNGTSTANTIVKILQSGEAVQVIEEDLASQYSLVETAEGKKGYVLSRFLDDMPSARERLAQSDQENENHRQSIAGLSEQINQLQANLSSTQTDNESLKNTLLASESELEKVRTASENTLNILGDNKRLQAVVTELRKEKQTLGEENSTLRDSTKMDWFIRGAAVSLIAFLLGIIVTRIRWSKKDSWGSY
ncbi:MAG: TIGR04211 family SH3 domain-containing protein [Gammaproteobacteria bacterium]|nr:TIGR04211 family SH3 domain-containing protein [Gammaproteobacteria bacterium]